MSLPEQHANLGPYSRCRKSTGATTRLKERMCTVEVGRPRSGSGQGALNTWLDI